MLSEISRYYAEWKKDRSDREATEQIMKFLRDCPPEDVRKVLDIAFGMQEPTEPRERLRQAVNNYMATVLGNYDEDTNERIYAGVLAFIHTLWFGEPYPFMMYGAIEEKKWWQFWK